MSAIGVIYEELVAYREKYGHCNVPKKWKKNLALANWVTRQRKNKYLLEHELIELLDMIGFDWDPLGNSWSEMFEMLKEYKLIHGHCDVPLNDSGNQKLAIWVNNQRSNENSMHIDRKKVLDDLGFIWDVEFYKWKKQYNLLKKFWKKNGHCNVPINYTKNEKLGRWVSTQRKNKKILSENKLKLPEKVKLLEEKVKLLDSIQFDWNPLETSWMLMFKALKKYMKKFGHCNVPHKSPKIGNWVGTQRKNKEGMSKKRIELLNSIGFAWRLN